MKPEELYSTYLTALDIVSTASQMFLEGFHQGEKNATEKTPLDLVTKYDRLLEELIRGELRKRFPGHGFLGEETSGSGRAAVPEGLTWVLDPIDGTNNFVHCAPECAISLALTLDKQPLIGVVCCPPLHRLYSACKGRGAFLNGAPIRTSSARDIKEALIGVEISMAPKSIELKQTLGKRTLAAAQNSQGLRSVGCAALSLAYVAQGVWDVYHCEGLYPWDYAAGLLLVLEAGGHVTDSRGGRFNIDNSQILAANSQEMAHKVAEMFSAEESIS